MTVQLAAGQKFGKLEVIERAGRDKHGRYVWRCKCDCGKIAVVRATNLKTGRVASCGCLKAAGLSTLRHGHKRRAGTSRAYSAWLNLRRRCTDEVSPGWKNYGGRGIIYDQSWDSFDRFLADMGEPATGTSLERINNDGPYSKDNCKWAGRVEQANNKSNVRLVEFSGESLTVPQWAKRLGISAQTLTDRLGRGWSKEKAFGTRRYATRCDVKIVEHDGLALTISEWADKIGISRGAISHRLRRGWSLDRVFAVGVFDTHGGFRPLKGGETSGRRRAHNSWVGLRQRCDKGAHGWGDRGISYDPRWSTFENFIADMGEPAPGSSLDRINVNGPYSRDNCRWATSGEQADNRRNTEFIEFSGKRKTLVGWARELGIVPGTLRSRLARMPIDRAMSVGRFNRDKKTSSEPKTVSAIEWSAQSAPDRRKGQTITSRSRFIDVNGERMTVAQAAKNSGVKYHTLLHRVRNGWPLDAAMAPETNAFRKQETAPRARKVDASPASFWTGVLSMGA